MEEDGGIKMQGYLQHKGKKRLISLWRRWYCVLNGHLLLFYRNEADYKKLGKFQNQIDLGLVYNVLRALGIENGIQITTHTGPHWLRCVDEKSCKLWLEFLQASIVLRRGSTLRKSRTESMSIEKPSISSRQMKAKSTIPQRYDEEQGGETTDSKKVGGPFARLSLSFIPGHGKKYSTYDTHRSYLENSESVAEDEWNNKEIENEGTNVSTKSPIPPKRKKKESKEPRPISESVSDFLLLNTSDSDKTADTGNNGDYLQIVRKRNSKSHHPVLPASSNVGKMLSHLGPMTNSKSCNSLLEVPCNPTLELPSRTSLSEIDKDIVVKPVMLVTTSEDTLVKRASETGKAHRKSPKEDLEQDISGANQNDRTIQHLESKDTKKEEVVKEEAAKMCQPDNETEKFERNIENGKKVKDPTRRKSGLAMLKQFFSSAKLSIKRMGDKSDNLSVTPDRSRKSSKEKTSARSSLNSDYEQQTSQGKIEPVKESTPTVTFHRLDSHVSEISEGVDSVREEIFVAKNAHSYGEANDSTDDRVPIITIHRQDSQLSQEVVPTLEENLIGGNDANEQPIFVEVCETEEPGLLAGSGEKLLALANSLEDVTFEGASIQYENPSEINRKSVDLIQSNRLSIDLIDRRRVEDEEIVESIPVLPIKTKTKCPSPGYDVPKSNPISIKDETQYEEGSTQDFDQSEPFCIAVEEPTDDISLIQNTSCQIEKTKIEDLPEKTTSSPITQDFDQSEPFCIAVEEPTDDISLTQYTSCQTEKTKIEDLPEKTTSSPIMPDFDQGEPFCITVDEPKGDKSLTQSISFQTEQTKIKDLPEKTTATPISTTSSNSVGGIRKLSKEKVDFFEKKSELTVKLSIPKRDSKSQSNASDRVSFALSETELVQEETVHILPTESFD